MKRILMIDDEQQILDSVQLILEAMDCEVTTFSDPTQGLQAALAERFDLILVDIRMPNMNGAEITAGVKQVYPDASILVLTGYPSDPLARKALDAGAAGLVRKPFEIAKILEYLER